MSDNIESPSKRPRIAPDPNLNPEWKEFNDRGDVIKDTNNWVLSPKVMDYAKDLLNCEIEINKDEDFLIFKMEKALQRKEVYEPEIFVSHQAKTVWTLIFNLCESGKMDHGIVTGNPGVGKSRSMAYLLWILLKNEKTIIYESRSDKNFYAFIPFKNSSGKCVYDGYSCGKSRFRIEECAALQNPNNYYLIDPVFPVPEKPCAAHTILAASPNKNRINEFMKGKKVFEFFIPVWTLTELECVREYMKVDIKESTRCLTKEELQNRYNICGGIPRYIFSEEKQFNLINNEINDAIIDLKLDKISQLIINTTKIGDQTSPGRYSSKIIAIQSLLDLDDNEKFYFYNINCRLSSAYVKICILRKYYNDMMNILNPKTRTINISDSGLGCFLEALSVSILMVGGSFETTNLEDGINSILDLPAAIVHYEENVWKNFSKKWNEILNNNSTNVILTGASNQPIVDIVDNHRRAFQITKNLVHKINGKQLYKLFSDELNDQFNNVNQLHLYFMIPEYMYDDFKLQIISWEGIKIDKVKEESITSRIVQHKLKIPPIIPKPLIEKIDFMISKMNRWFI